MQGIGAIVSISLILVLIAIPAKAVNEDLMLWESSVEFTLLNLQDSYPDSRIDVCFVLSVIYSATGGKPAQILGDGEFWGLMGLPKDCSFPEELYIEGLLDPLVNIVFGIDRLLQAERVVLTTLTSEAPTRDLQTGLDYRTVLAGTAALYSAGISRDNVIRYFAGESIGRQFANAVMLTHEVLCDTIWQRPEYSLTAYRSGDAARLLAVVVSELETGYRIGHNNERWKDCSSFAQHVFREGPQIVIPRTTSGMIHAFRAKHLLAEANGFKLSNLRTGDLLLMDRSICGTRYGHVAIVINNNGYVVENSKEAGGVICHRVNQIPEIYDYVVRFDDIWRLNHE